MRILVRNSRQHFNKWKKYARCALYYGYDHSSYKHVWSARKCDFANKAPRCMWLMTSREQYLTYNVNILFFVLLWAKLTILRLLPFFMIKHVINVEKNRRPSATYNKLPKALQRVLYFLLKFSFHFCFFHFFFLSHIFVL